MNKARRQQLDREVTLARHVGHTFRQQFGFLTGLRYMARWAFDEGQLNRSEFDALRAGSQDPGPVEYWPAQLRESIEQSRAAADHNAPSEPQFELANDRPKHRPASFEGTTARQRPLFAGLDCLAGQQDLFATDGSDG